MIQLNLLPDVKKEFLKAQKTKALVISGAILVTIGAVGLTALLFLYVTFGQQLQITLITNDIKNKTNELNSVPDIDKYLTVQNQLKALPELHDGKGVYSRLFAFLPILNPVAPNNVTLTSLDLDSADESVTFSGTSATFEALNVFVDTLNNATATYRVEGADETNNEKIFNEVSVQSSGLAKVNDVSRVSFILNVKYNPSVFDARNSDVNATVPNIETTPSVTGSPSGQLFDESGEDQ